MYKKISLQAYQILFRLFAYLADKSGGCHVFVHPKLLIGSLIVGLGLTNSGQVEAQQQTVNQLRKKEPVKNKNDSIQSKIVEGTVFCYVSEQMPQYPGGEGELLNFIAKNLKYPDAAIKNKIQGKVIIRFVITEKGEIEKVEVIRSLYPECDQEAIRIIKSLSKFTPGKQNGKITKVWYTIPITFKLEK